MFERSISDVDVRKVLVDGVMIEDYPDDQPYPSFLVLAWVNGRPLHVVAADNDADHETIIITVYEPDADKWQDEFRQRRHT